MRQARSWRSIAKIHGADGGSGRRREFPPEAGHALATDAHGSVKESRGRSDPLKQPGQASPSEGIRFRLDGSCLYNVVVVVILKDWRDLQRAADEVEGGGSLLARTLLAFAED